MCRTADGRYKRGKHISYYFNCTPNPLTCQLSWTLVYIAQHVWHLYIARVCVGFTCGGVFICLALFVAEIATETIRGRLSALMQVCFNSGILLGMVAGTWIEYHMIPLVMVFLPMAFLLLFVLVPQTPQWLLRSNRIAEAEQSLRFYRNCRLANRFDNKEQEELFRQEFDRMQTVAAQSSTAVVTLSDFREFTYTFNIYKSIF